MQKSIRDSFLAIIRAAVTNEKKPLPEEFRLTEAFGIAVRQKMTNLFYAGTQVLQVQISEELQCNIARTAGKELYVQQSQQFALEQIYAALEAAGADYLPMKGAVLRELYPQPYMRFMCDIDILIRKEQYPAIAAAMESLGFVLEKENDPEMVWKRNTVSVELHYNRLFATCNRDFNRYYKDGWQMAARVGESCRFELRQEDMLIFLLTHLAKHYRNGGAELRNLLDIYVYQAANPQMDAEYIQQELKELGLDVFYQNVNRTLSGWLGNEPWDPMCDRIIDAVLAGCQIKTNALVLSIAAREHATGSAPKHVRFQRLRDMIFLPYGRMCKKYPVLKKVPILLPVFWVVRWVDAILFKRKRIRKFSNEVAVLKQENIDTYHDGLKEVGLDFNF